jgi:uncharacterized OsmC-like protein
MSTDAIVILKQDHKDIKKLFKDFRAAGDGATKKKADIVKKIIEALCPMSNMTSSSPTRSTTSQTFL